jgi:DNA mismatch endonuclease (patch repair protein)
MDVLTPDQRRAVMRAIRSRNTSPEMTVRRIVHAMGLRFRLHRRDLPGTPDLVLPRWQLAVFVHGCFWHQHPGCRFATQPATRRKFWLAKFAANVERDQRAVRALRRLGWRIAVIWGCEVAKPALVRRRIRRSLAGPLASR